VPPEWHKTAEILKSRPGAVTIEEIPGEEQGAFPVFHCSQKIPCNPCSSICPKGCIAIESGDIMGLPVFKHDKNSACAACEQCVAVCPGLAITLVDYRKSQPSGCALVSIPYEFSGAAMHAGSVVTVLDTMGGVLGNVKVDSAHASKAANKVLIVKVRAPFAIAKKIAGIRVQEPWQVPWVAGPMEEKIQRIDDDEIVCRCERVTACRLRTLIRAGVRDMNQLKARTRAGMGSCGGKTCRNLIRNLFREEGVTLSEVTDFTRRPLFVEVPLGTFAGIDSHDGPVRDEVRRHDVGTMQGGV
jgi:Fe-S-cluster-containing hydrogenase component 2/bacterioferritin-associated ferredoxin